MYSIDLTDDNSIFVAEAGNSTYIYTHSEDRFTINGSKLCDTSVVGVDITGDG